MWIEWERQGINAEDRRGKLLDNIQVENREVDCRITSRLILDERL
jgi:hypothetical protein